MKDQLATIDTGAMQEEPTGAFLWQSADKATRVSFSADAVEGIRKEVLRGFAAIPKRGAEVGGILLGRRERGQPLSIAIEKFQPVTSEYRGGPSYSLSDADQMALKEVLAQQRLKGSTEFEVVGFFRSHTRPSLFLSSDDQVLFQKFFADPANVIMLVKPHVSGNCRAALFFWDQDKVPSQSFYPEFPFGPQRAMLAPAETTDTGGIYAPGPPSAAPAAPLYGGSARAVRNHVPNRGSPWKFAIALAICLPLALAASFFAIKLMDIGGSGGRKPVALGLQIEKKGESVLVSWDRGSPFIATAPRGVLSIRDGSHQQIVQLDAEQLRTGTVFYTPGSPDVEFRLDVSQGENSTVSESLRVLAAGGASAEISPVSVRATRPTAPPLTHEPEPRTVIRQTASPPRVWSAEGLGRPAGQQAAAPTTIGQPPSLNPGLGTFESLPTVLAASPTAPPPVVTAPPPAKALHEPAPAPVTPPAVGQARVVIAQPRIYVAPRILKRVSPVLTASAKSLVHSQAQVHIKIGIDENGKVASAAAVGSSGLVNVYLREAALNAARLWQFEPAKDTGKSVPSEMTLTFRFTP